MTKLTIELSNDAYERVDRAAKAEGVSLAEFVRRALNLQGAVQEVVRAAGDGDQKVYVGDAQAGELHELQVA